MRMFVKVVLWSALAGVALLGGASADENLKPFYLAWQGPGQLQDKIAELRACEKTPTFSCTLD